MHLSHVLPSSIFTLLLLRKKKSSQSNCGASPYFTAEHCHALTIPVFQSVKVSTAQLSKGVYFFISYLYPGSGFHSTSLYSLLKCLGQKHIDLDLRRSTNDFMFISASRVLGTSELYRTLNINSVFTRVVIHSTHIY